MSMKSQISPTYIGRRKCAIALVRFVKGNGDFIINGKTGFNYLQEDPFAIQTVVAPLKLINLEKKYNIICSVRGGGICAQAEAIQLGIARALCSLTLPSYGSRVYDERFYFQSSEGELQNKQDKNTNKEDSTHATYGDESKIQEAAYAPESGQEAKRAQKTNSQQGARPLLKEQGYLRRDSRIKERRKYGLKKARKAEQYSKR